MTEKKEKILLTALELFALKGVDATSTNKIARISGVSEGLIFRHFTNKEGLLNSILNYGYEIALTKLDLLKQETDPLQLIEQVIRHPYSLSKEEAKFWKLIYALKWQRGLYNHEVTNTLKELLQTAFEKLHFKNPEQESNVLILILDGAMTDHLLKDTTDDPEPVIQTILSKYKLNKNQL